MIQKPYKRPTDAELSILRLLWRHGDMTVMEVYLALPTSRSSPYTTTLTKLQFMCKKGLLRRDDSQKAHVYSAVKTQRQTEKSVVRSLIRDAFAGSARNLVLYALVLKKAPQDLIDHVTAFFEEVEK